MNVEHYIRPGTDPLPPDFRLLASAWMAAEQGRLAEPFEMLL
jgi:hypothetical protein